MKIKTRGLVLREMNIRDNDKLLFILSEDLGPIRAFANGVRKMGHKNAAASSALCFADFTLNKSRSGDTYTVTETEVIEIFFELRRDILNLTTAQYICEICGNFAAENEPAGEILSLALNCLYCLAKGRQSPYLIKAVAELRLCTICGYMPDLDLCAQCGASHSDMLLNISDGRIYCSSCAGASLEFLRLDATLLAAMRHITLAEPKRIFSFKIPEPYEKKLSYITEKYSINQTEQKPKTLSFLHTLD